MSLRISSLLVALSLATSVFGQDIEIVPLDVDIRYPPVAVPADGKHLLLYELHVTNVGDTGDVKLVKVEILESGDGNTAAIEGERLADSIRRLGPEGGSPALVGPGIRAIVYLLLMSQSPPDRVRHRLTVEDGESTKTLECCEVPLSINSLRLAAPVRGKDWKAVNGPGNGTHHRRSVIPMAGRLTIPQRFAIDWIQTFPDGEWHSGDPLDNSNYRTYGAEALAVADAQVSFIKDGIPENVPDNEKRAVPMTLENMGGNLVVLDLGADRYAFYGHLQPGSIRVKPGERVRAGQVLGLVGNSGNSTAPHLHFHVSDRPSILEGEGLPYVIDEFWVQGEKHQDELPLKDWSVDLREGATR